LENMTRFAPKTIDDIESLMASGLDRKL